MLHVENGAVQSNGFFSVYSFLLPRVGLCDTLQVLEMIIVYQFIAFKVVDIVL